MLPFIEMEQTSIEMRTVLFGSKISCYSMKTFDTLHKTFIIICNVITNNVNKDDERKRKWRSSDREHYQPSMYVILSMQSCPSNKIIWHTNVDTVSDTVSTPDFILSYWVNINNKSIENKLNIIQICNLMIHFGHILFEI